MVRYALFLSIAIAALFQSCAEYTAITGGEGDTTAPKPVPGKQYPEQGAVYYTGSTIGVTFDEFVKINDPANTMTMNPDAGKLTAELKRKTLTIRWADSLRANTTYILQLNGTIRDLNADNDSIMQLVFSTGAVIDSLSLTGKVTHSKENKAVGQVSVGLYLPGTDPLLEKPVYATRSDASGTFRFDYLKPGNYDLFGFVDLNKDQLPQPGEIQAFLDHPVSASDTVPVELFAFPTPVRHKKLQIAFLPPENALVYNRDSLDLNQLTFNGNPVSVIESFSPDSALVAIDGVAGTNQFIYGTDTLIKSYIPKETKKMLQVTPPGNTKTWQKGDSIQFRVNDLIQQTDTSLVVLRTVKGNRVNFTVAQTAVNSFSVIPVPETKEDFTLRLEKGAVHGRTLVNDTVSYKFDTHLPEDLCDLKLTCSGLEGQWIIELTQKDREVYTLIKPAGDSIVQFRQIEPGEYGVRCTEDKNGNGKWDTGSFTSKTQPELILRFVLEQKLRANWEVEETVKRTP